MTITVGCTLAPFKMSGDWHNWGAWLANAEAVQESSDEPVKYFAALEVDARGLKPYSALLMRLAQVGGAYWTFSYDDGADVITTQNRLRRICAGHNMVGTYAIENGSSHCLFLASDTQARDDVLPRLLELDVAAAACHITTYCLDGPPVTGVKRLEWLNSLPGHPDVRVHMESCACMMLRRDVFLRLKWRYDPDAGLTDDPAMHADLRDFMDEEVYVRHDVLATHWPESIPSIEYRHTSEQRRVHHAS